MAKSIFMQRLEEAQNRAKQNKKFDFSDKKELCEQLGDIFTSLSEAYGGLEAYLNSDERNETANKFMRSAIEFVQNEFKDLEQLDFNKEYEHMLKILDETI